MNRTRRVSQILFIAVMVSVCCATPTRAAPEASAEQRPSLIDAEAAKIAEPLMRSFVTAWNTHQLIGFDEIFWPDSAFIHRGGQLISGGVKIRDYHAKLHTDPLIASSRITLVIERAQWLAPNVIIVTNRSHGWLGPKQDIKIDSLPTFVITQKAGAWKIAFGQNTEVRPPRQ